MLNNDPLSSGELDKELTVWGVAVGDSVRSVGMGDVGHDRVRELCDSPDATGKPVYYHPDFSWMYATEGRGTERERDIDDEWER